MTHVPNPSPGPSTGPSLRVLVKPGQAIPRGAPKTAADGGPYTLRGTTANFQVSYEDALGASGPILADAALATCEADYTSLRTWFGGLTPGGLPFTLFVVTGTFGAYHASCAATELHLAAFDGTNVDLVRMLMVAEADEVMMAAQNLGWDCGASHGEGLSRILSTELYPAQLNGFATAASWLDSSRPDWVTTTEPTDQNYVSIGCATLFLNYLRHQLGYRLTAIVGAGAPTLAQVYTKLSGKTDAFAPFNALLQQRFPAGRPSGLTNDNPFPIAP
jgi:hypothetical protein